MTIGVLTFEIHLPDARSLKGKRQVVRRLRDRLRSRHNVSVAELGEHADLWQRASLAVVAVAHARDALERAFESVRNDVEAQVPGLMIETGVEYIESVDGGPSGWSDDWK